MSPLFRRDSHDEAAALQAAKLQAERAETEARQRAAAPKAQVVVATGRIVRVRFTPEVLP